MDKLERAHRLHKILKQRHTPASLAYLCERLECETRTVTRLIADMRLYLHVPILNTPGQGYFYANDSTFELPGVWFSPEEEWFPDQESRWLDANTFEIQSHYMTTRHVMIAAKNFDFGTLE